MKRAAYSFLLILLLSCGNAPKLSNNRIRIEFRDSVKEQYYLLAVRDSSLVVSHDMQTPDSTAGAAVIPFARIRKIICFPDTTDTKMLTGMSLGVVAGIVAPTLATPLIGTAGAAYMILYLVPIGMVTGGIIGCESSRSRSEYDPYRPVDRNHLKALARFPYSEPEYLQKIK